MSASPFADILERVVRALPGARGAIFIDWEGEEVGSFVQSSDMEIRLVGAHWGIVFNLISKALGRTGLGAPEEILLRFDDQQVIIEQVDEGYIAVITMGTEANLGRGMGLARQASAQLRREM